MDDHEDTDHPWAPRCDFLCNRRDLVTSVLQLVQQTGRVVIRATPQVGKSTLLKLLGRHILHNEKDLEPVFVHWMPNRKRDYLPYKEYLSRKKSLWQERNRSIRPHNPKARTVYLIDEAQDSYDEEEFWTELLKKHHIGSQDLYVLVCLYGASANAYDQKPKTASQASKVDTFQRVELRPSRPGSLHLLFDTSEISETVSKWASPNNVTLSGDVYEYLRVATDGHPGILGMLLQYIQGKCFKAVGREQSPTTWSPSDFHDLIVDDEELIAYVELNGRGIWSKEEEKFVRERIRDPEYHNKFIFNKIVKALSEVAQLPRGYTRCPLGFDEFEFCCQTGHLHKENHGKGGDETTYFFASPIHQRTFYRRFFPGPEPGTKLESMSLREVCLNAIEKFNLPTLHKRTKIEGSSWKIPEAAFQDEMYCCLSDKLCKLPIMTEYSHNREDGRIDFYVYDKSWGIETLQHGSEKAIKDHAGRFLPSAGKYWKWHIFQDYIIINFCPPDAVRKIQIEDKTVESHILQIAVDFENDSMTAYTHDQRLIKSLTSDGGKSRFSTNNIDSRPQAYPGQTFQSRLIQTDEANADLRREIAELKRSLEIAQGQQPPEQEKSSTDDSSRRKRRKIE